MRSEKKNSASESERVVTLGSLRNDDATPRTTSIKKSIYVLSTIFAIILSHLLCLSLSKLAQN